MPFIRAKTRLARAARNATCDMGQHSYQVLQVGVKIAPRPESIQHGHQAPAWASHRWRTAARQALRHRFQRRAAAVAAADGGRTWGAHRNPRSDGKRPAGLVFWRGDQVFRGTARGGQTLCCADEKPSARIPDAARMPFIRAEDAVRARRAQLHPQHGTTFISGAASRC